MKKTAEQIGSEVLVKLSLSAPPRLRLPETLTRLPLPPGSHPLARVGEGAIASTEALDKAYEARMLEEFQAALAKAK